MAQSVVERVREAVRDEEWQRFRKSLKGTTTQNKLEQLREWWEDRHELLLLLEWDWHMTHEPTCKTCVQVDNYLKALARGGQLPARVSVRTAVLYDFNLKVRK